MVVGIPLGIVVGIELGTALGLGDGIELGVVVGIPLGDALGITLGKALGGASGGFTTGKKVFIDLLRQRSRPYLFSNTLAPAIAAAGIEAFNMISQTTELRDTLERNTRFFRSEIESIGFDIKNGEHPIVPIMTYDALTSQKMASALLDEGIYVIGFFYPVVPKDQARLRVQISAGMSELHLEEALAAFKKVGKKFKLV